MIFHGIYHDIIGEEGELRGWLLDRGTATMGERWERGGAIGNKVREGEGD